jgi:hypothetical protein
MELRVRDVASNMRCKGNETAYDINNMHDSLGCKSAFRLGTSSCGNQSCKECFDTLITDLEKRDINATRGDDPCDGCDEDCDGCEYND